MPVKQIAEHFGVHRTTITKIVTSAGVKVRSQPLASSTREEARHLYDSGRSLAQVAEQFEEYGAGYKLNMALLIGGVSFGDQEKKLNAGADVLIATPGRLMDHFGRGGKAVGIMAIVTTFSYIIWLDIAVALYVMFFSMKPLRFDALLEAIITTPKGMVFFLVGNGIGAVLAVIVFSIMVISLPMVFDRQVDFVTAMITSVKSVLMNPKPMLLWCAIIGVLLGLSLVAMFAGLLIVLPILGHSTWHLYKRVVAAEPDSPPPQTA